MVPKKVAIVAEWLTWRGGGEAVVDALLEVFPDADLYTTVYNKQNLPEYKKFSPKTSFLQKIPIVRKKHQALPPLLLKAIASLDLSGHDLIISSSSSIGKGIKKPIGSTHVCYCHTPMRYVWQTNIDGRLINLPFGKSFLNYLKRWDLENNMGVDYFITNSNYTREKIGKYYKREATVIYPPVDLDAKCKTNCKKDYYLCLSRLITYKKFDLAIKACENLNKNLVVAGDGPEMSNLKSLSNGQTKFTGRVNEQEKSKLLSDARALIFPGEEDFGIVPIEAMACSTPVIAYDKGGVTETVINGICGILFRPQSVEALEQAIEKLEKTQFDPMAIKNQAQKFSKNRFKAKISKFIENIK